MMIGSATSSRLVAGWRRVLSAGGVALALMALASCGGGDRVSTFSPQRLLVFGDESSVIAGSNNLTDVDGNVITAQAGAKYAVNAFAVDASGNPTTAYACANNVIWIQVLAGRYGFGFPECNPYSYAPAGRIYAQVGAKVANVATQVAAHVATGGFVNTDLVTVMVGQRDILAAYALYPTQSADAVVAIAETAGRALGVQVNAIANAGGRVLAATVPNQGSTPFGQAQNAIGGERAALLQRMTERFNAGMRATLINDGRLIGLVQADEQLQLISSNAPVFGYSNVTNGACTTAPPACTPSTLATGATLSNYLWVDDLHFNVDAHARIGNLAVTRAVNNPF